MEAAFVRDSSLALAEGLHIRRSSVKSKLPKSASKKPKFQSPKLPRNFDRMKPVSARHKEPQKVEPYFVARTA
jgi:hypothetical protein